jgi:hypothetical protein
MFHGQAVVDQLGEGIDADAQMAVHEFRVDDVAAHCGFHALGDHRLIGDEEECAGPRAIDRNQSAGDRRIVSGLRCIWLRCNLSCSKARP